RIRRLSIQSDVGTRPPSTSTPCSQKTRSPLSNSGYPRSDAHLTGFLRDAGAGCLPEILQLPPPQEEGHLLQRTAPCPLLLCGRLADGQGTRQVQRIVGPQRVS